MNPQDRLELGEDIFGQAIGEVARKSSLSSAVVSVMMAPSGQGGCRGQSVESALIALSYVLSSSTSRKLIARRDA